jgi:DNA-binding transcriptional regulator YiaG
VAATEEADVSRTNRRYEIHAVETKDGYVPAFRYPGKDERERVLDETGRPKIEQYEGDAYAEAGLALCRALNGRSRSKTSRGYQRLDGAEFAGLLGDAGVTPAEFAIIFGTRTDRVVDWLDDVEDIPHAARTLLALLALPGAVSIARQIAATVSFDKRNEKREAAQ